MQEFQPALNVHLQNSNHCSVLSASPTVIIYHKSQLAVIEGWVPTLAHTSQLSSKQNYAN